MRILRASILSSGKTSIVYAELHGDDWETHAVESPDEPLPAFGESLQKLDSYIAKNCRLEKKAVNDIDVTGVTWSYKGDTACKVTVRGKLEMEDSNSPLNLSVPLRTLWKDGEQEPEDQIDAKTRELIEAFELQCQKYVNGERKQADLPGIDPDGNDQGGDSTEGEAA